MRKRILSGITSIALMASLVIPASAADIQTAGSTGTATVPANVTATTMSVTVPLQLPITVNASGEATYATNAVIKNSSFGPVVVKDASITGQNGWSIASFDTDMAKQPAGTKKIAFSLNGCETDGKNASIPGVYSALGIINGGGTEVALTYASKIPAQTAALDATNAAKVVFTVDWYKGTGGSVVPDNGSEEEPTYTVGESYPIALEFDGVPEGQDTVTWKSTDESVATVVESTVATMSLVSGVKRAIVTIVGPGSCEITATLGNGYTKSMPITATPAVPEVTGIKLTGNNKLLKDLSYYIQVLSIPDGSSLDSNEKIQAVSSNSSVVAVDSTSGNDIYITAKDIGKATITATYKRMEATFDLEVEPRVATMKNWAEEDTSDFHSSTYANQINTVTILNIDDEVPLGTEFDISANGDGSVKATLSGSTLYIHSDKALGNLGNFMIAGTAAETVNIGAEFEGNLDGRALYCSTLREIKVDYGGFNYKSMDGALMNYDETKLIAYPSALTQISFNTDSYLRNTVTEIGDYALYKAANLQSLTVGENITTIGKHAFESVPRDYGEDGLFPSDLREIRIGSNVQSIGEGAFKWAGILDITIPASVKSIDSTAFSECSKLMDITVESGGTTIGKPWGATNATVTTK